MEGCALNCSTQSREEEARGREWMAVADVATPSTNTTGNTARWGLVCVCVCVCAHYVCSYASANIPPMK